MDIPRHDILIVRGDTFEKDVALVTGFEDIRDAPYTARMVFRTEQHDELPELLELSASPEPPEPGEDAFAYLHFSATPEQTQLLPGYDIVYFVELVAQNANLKTRLFQGAALIRD